MIRNYETYSQGELSLLSHSHWSLLVFPLILGGNLSFALQSQHAGHISNLELTAKFKVSHLLLNLFSSMTTQLIK